MEAPQLQHQAMDTNSLQEVLGCSKTQQPQEKRLRHQPEQALRCPRCDSLNTKFCYYNNYSLSQPRYFCKGCRRYWTKGGSLRNVPVGGGCRKNKRTPSSSSLKKSQDQALTTNSNSLMSALQPPPQTVGYDPNDLSLAFARLQKPPTAAQSGLDDQDPLILGSPNPNSLSNSPPGFLDILRNGFLDTSTSAFQNLYYGFGGNLNAGEVEGVGEEVVLPFDGMGTDATSSSVKQESCKSLDGDDHNNKGLMGLHWQLGGDVNYVVDSGRDYWNNNAVGSSWHGLVNSSLM